MQAFTELRKHALAKRDKAKGATPAMASGMTGKAWSIMELIERWPLSRIPPIRYNKEPPERTGALPTSNTLMPVKKLLLYLDDSGTRDPNHKAQYRDDGMDWFGLGGILINEEDVNGGEIWL